MRKQSKRKKPLVRTEKAKARLERYKHRQILFRKFDSTLRKETP
jgi:hypothetical protein